MCACFCLFLYVHTGFDYSRLSSAHKGLTGKKERESLSRKLKEEIDAAAAELAASAPNMKALEQYEAIRDKEKQQVRAIACV
jgi:structural maintenance of chromosome 1